MQSRHVTLADFLANEMLKGDTANVGRLCILLGEIAQAVRFIASLIETVALEGDTLEGSAELPVEIAAREVLAALCERSVAGYACAGMDAIRATTARGGYLLAFDALDGAALTSENGVAGSVFSVREARGQTLSDDALLSDGHTQCAAGYAVYGPSTMLVLTLGRGTHGFTLSRESGAFVLTHRSIQVPKEGAEVSIDGTRERCWAPPVSRYVRECREGSVGERERDFGMRFTGCAMADVHRILMRGGVSIMPCEHRETQGAGGPRLVHTAQALAWVVEQAGGAASTGCERVLDLRPGTIDERVGTVLGSACEVARIERYYREYERGVDRPFISPLFNERSLYRPEACA